MVQRRRYADATVAMVAEAFEKLGYRIRRGGIMNNSTAPKLPDRRFREMFGCSSIVCANACIELVTIAYGVSIGNTTANDVLLNLY